MLVQEPDLEEELERVMAEELGAEVRCVHCRLQALLRLCIPVGGPES